MTLIISSRRKPVFNPVYLTIYALNEHSWLYFDKIFFIPLYLMNILKIKKISFIYIIIHNDTLTKQFLWSSTQILPDGLCFLIWDRKTLFLPCNSFSSIGKLLGLPLFYTVNFPLAVNPWTTCLLQFTKEVLPCNSQFKLSALW